MKRKGFYWLLTLILTSLLLVWVFHTPSTEKSSKKNMVKEQKADLEFSQSKLTEWVDKQINWELLSQHLEMNKEKNIITLKKCSAAFYKNKQKTLTMQSEKGVYHLDSKNIVLEGHVLVQSTQGQVLRVEKIQLQSAEKKIVGQGAVFFRQGNTIITGNSFQSDLAMDNIEILGNVKVTMGGK